MGEIKKNICFQFDLKIIVLIEKWLFSVLIDDEVDLHGVTLFSTIGYIETEVEVLIYIYCYLKAVITKSIGLT